MKIMAKNKKVIIVGSGYSGKGTPWYDQNYKDLVIQKSKLGIGFVQQLDKFAKQKPTDYSKPIDFESIKKHWDEISKENKPDPFFDNPYLTTQNKKKINKGVLSVLEHKKSKYHK